MTRSSEDYIHELVFESDSGSDNDDAECDDGEEIDGPSDMPHTQPAITRYVGTNNPRGYPVGMLASVVESVRRRTPDVARNAGAPLQFQLGTCEACVGATSEYILGIKPPRCGRDAAESNLMKLHRPFIRMTGVTVDGLSVMVRVWGFEPYCYIEVPSDEVTSTLGVTRFTDGSAAWCEEFRAALNSAIDANREVEMASEAGRSADRGIRKYMRLDSADGTDALRGVATPYPTVIEITAVKCRPLRGYIPVIGKMLRVVVRLPSWLSRLRRTVEGLYNHPCTYEADIDYALRFMVDNNISGCAWLQIDTRPVIDSQFSVQTLWKPAADLLAGTDANTLSADTVSNFVTAESDLVARLQRDTQPTAGWSMVMAYNEMSHDTVVSPPSGTPLEGRSNVEVDVWHTRVACLGMNGQWSRHANLRILSFDAEMASLSRSFPHADEDPVITIATHMTTTRTRPPETLPDTLPDGWYNEHADESVVFQLKECAPVNTPGTRTVWFETEQSLLLAWRDLVVAYDPDIITGFNTNNFDFPYLFERARRLGIDNRFSDLSRVRGYHVNCKNKQFSSRASGVIENKQLDIPGRMLFDARQAAQRKYKLPSYSLNEVAKMVDQQKIEMDHRELPKLFFDGGPADRARIATYCAQDAAIPTILMRKLMWIVDAVEMARATHTPYTYELSRGQQIKGIAIMLHETRAQNIVISSAGNSSTQAGARYTGATVLDPMTGFHDTTVTTLDFSSLYPSIIICHNMDYTTLLSEEQAGMLHPKNVWKSPAGFYFLRAPKSYPPDKLLALGLVPDRDIYNIPNGRASLRDGFKITAEIVAALELEPGVDYDETTMATSTERRLGILPVALMRLTSLRNVAKCLMETYPEGSIERGVYNGRQNALKVQSNSMYGLTGASKGRAPAVEIAMSVTSRGRELIDFTKDVVQTNFKREFGYENDAIVIYGDTDSVMVRFLPEVPSLTSALRLTESVIKEYAVKTIDDAINPKVAVQTKLRIKDCAAQMSTTWSCKCATGAHKPPPPKPPHAAAPNSAIVLQPPRPHFDPESLNRIYAEVAAEFLANHSALPPSQLPNTPDQYKAHVEKTKYVVSQVHEFIKILFARAARVFNVAALNSPFPPSFIINIRREIDRVMVERSAVLGKLACQLVTSRLEPPLNLAFEKVFLPYVIVSRKRYSGVKWVWDKDNSRMKQLPRISTMGFETVRRDGCSLLRGTMECVLSDILVLRDVSHAIQTVRRIIHDIRCNKVTLDRYIVTQALSKTPSDLTQTQPHTALAKRINSKLPPDSQRYRLGDRVSMIFITSSRGKKLSDQSEDPIDVATNHLPIDVDYYIKNRIKQPMSRIFTQVVLDKTLVDLVYDPSIAIDDAIKSVVTSASHQPTITPTPSVRASEVSNHTRVSNQVKSTARNGIERFLTVASEHCLRCNSSINVPPGQKHAQAICNACLSVITPSETASLVHSVNMDIEELRSRMEQLDIHCTSCKRGNTVSCTNSECAITYMRFHLTDEMTLAETMRLRHTLPQFTAEVHLFSKK